MATESLPPETAAITERRAEKSRFEKSGVTSGSAGRQRLFLLDAFLQRRGCLRVALVDFAEGGAGDVALLHDVEGRHPGLKAATAK